MKSPSSSERSPGDFSTPSLDRALAVLESLALRTGGLTQTELAAELGLTANFVYRTTQSLLAHGYLIRDSHKRFRLSGKLLRLGQPVVDDVPLAEAALPAMRWLSEETGEASHLGIVVDGAGLVLERVLGTAPIKFYVERGTRFPLHTSAPGKCVLAFLDESERDEILGGYRFETFHPWTISDRAEFEGCLARVREEGFATDLGEHLEGHHCLGAPVFDREDRAVASLWITGPSQRLDEGRVAALADTVVEAGRMATRTLRGEVVR
jgi:DNA-binding IclR family transcriptional regulator